MNRFYFDHNATTPVAREVLENMTEVLRVGFGNPSSAHAEGQMARRLIEDARRQIASNIGASATELVFTSGGTEANNLAILGLVRGRPGAHVITTAIEHAAVLEPCRQLEREGVDVTYVPVDGSGVVDIAAIEDSLRPETVLMSVMHANNEVGTVQPVSGIANLVRKVRAGGRQIYLHSDGVQGFGKLPVNVRELGVDLYSMSAHKIHGPKGTGALYVRKGVPLRAVQFGGKHERERRAGTENVTGAVAFAKAAEIASGNPGFESIAALRNRFEQQVLNEVSATTINGDRDQRLPNTSNIHFEGVGGEAMVIALDMRGFAVSSGAACSSGSIEPSHVLLAMGLAPEEARRCVRFSWGRGNTAEQTDALAGAVIACARQLRASRERKGASNEYARA
jgi:cysteine desulfurase